MKKIVTVASAFLFALSLIAVPAKFVFAEDAKPAAEKKDEKKADKKEKKDEKKKEEKKEEKK